MAEDKKGKLAEMLASISSNEDKLDRLLTALSKVVEPTSDSASSSTSKRPSESINSNWGVLLCHNKKWSLLTTVH